MEKLSALTGSLQKIRDSSFLTDLNVFLRTDIGLSLLIAVLWQSALTLIGWLLSPDQSPLDHMNHWDAGWYKHIIEHAYSPAGSPAAPAFYPLFPFTVWLTTLLSFGILDQNAAALLINSVALWAILLALIRIAAKFNIHMPTAGIVLLSFLSFPSAFFLHVFYGEAIFLALAFWAYLFTLNRQWGIACILLAVLTASRLPSLLFVVLCGLEFLRAHQWDIKKSLNRHLLWFLLTPLGLVAYSIYLHVVRGDFLAMLHAYSATDDWTYHTFNPNIFSTLASTSMKIIYSLFSPRPTYEAFINYALPLACILGVIACSIYLIHQLKARGVPLAAFGLLSVILFTINSNVVSVHRYSLVCLPLFIAAGLLAKYTIPRYGIIMTCGISIFVQLFIYQKFISDIFAG